MTATYSEMRTAEEVEIDAEILERVKRGMAFLERAHGPGWEDHIDMDTLLLRDASRCVLGQVYDQEGRDDREGEMEGFWWAIRRFDDLQGDGDVSHGFCVRVGEEPWEPLQRAWETVLAPRVRRRDADL